MAAYGAMGQGKVQPATILEIDVENSVRYQEDSSDLSKFATDPNVTTAIPPRNFFFRLNIGDIVAVNGQLPTSSMTHWFLRSNPSLAAHAWRTTRSRYSLATKS